VALAVFNPNKLSEPEVQEAEKAGKLTELLVMATTPFSFNRLQRRLQKDFDQCLPASDEGR
jgi:hypothetical protein